MVYNTQFMVYIYIYIVSFYNFYIDHSKFLFYIVIAIYENFHYNLFFVYIIFNKLFIPSLNIFLKYKYFRLRICLVRGLGAEME